MERGFGLLKPGKKTTFADILHTIEQIPNRFKPELIKELETFLLNIIPNDITNIQRKKESYCLFISNSNFHSKPDFHSWLGIIVHNLIATYLEVKWYQFKKKKIKEKLEYYSIVVEDLIDSMRETNYFNEINQTLSNYYSNLSFLKV